MKTSTIAALIAALLLARPAMAQPTLTGTPEELRAHLDALQGQVTINGTAERTVEADRAVVQLSLVTTDRQLKPALERNSTLRAQIVQSLAAAGVGADRIHTSRFASTPVRSMWSGKVKEYQISGTVRVQAESEKEVQAVAVLVDKMDGVSLESIVFEVTNKEEIAGELLKEALQRAEERRKTYETSLGVRLHPHRVQIPGAPDKGNPRTQYVLGQRKGESYQPSMPDYPMEVSLHALAAKPGPDPNASQFDELVYKVVVTVVYDLTPPPAK